MNRIHLHLRVNDLDEARRFYGAMLGSEPSRIESDFLQWKLEDPAVNLSVSHADGDSGVAHLGLDLASNDELDALRDRMTDAAVPTRHENDADCCYARSNKAWLEDPAGVTWEAFHSYAAGDHLQGPSESGCCGHEKVACCA